MFRNYFKVAFRTLVRSKAYSLINVLGLTIGISGATLLLMYVNDELTFDSFHSDSENIYRITTEDKRTDGSRFYGRTFPQLGDLLKDELPEVEDEITIYRTRGQINFRLDGKRITEENWWMSDENFFEFFDFELLDGSPEGVLDDPYSIVLSKSLSRKYFGDENPIGKVISEFDWGDFKVTGIFKDVPGNSHLQFDLIVGANFQSDDNWTDYITSWESANTYSYVRLNKNSTGDTFEGPINDLLSKHAGVEVANGYEVELQALRDIHFGSNNIELGTDQFNKGDRSYVYVFSSIALFLLIIAAVNYTNLATSKALFRAKEIGVRKVVGAKKAQLAIQFLMESVLITLLATIISIGVIDLVMPFYNQITGKDFEFGLAALSQYAPLLLSVAIFTGLLAGLYPALFITRFRPVKVLKGESIMNQGKTSLRKVLVVLQFGLSIVMIIATLVVSNQMRYISNRDVGFYTEGIMVVDINSFYTRRDFKLMKTEFQNISGIESVATASRVPGEWKTINEIYVRRGDSPDSLQTYYMGFDGDMLGTFGFKMALGRYFSGNDQNDSTKVILNESAVRALGLENPVGQNIKLYRTATRRLDATVIGVVKDFNYQSFHTGVAPLVIGAWNSGIRAIDYFALKINANNMSSVIEQVEAVHNRFDPATTIEYNFVDDRLKMKYEKEQSANNIFQLGSGLSILVACLGLFGLASFTVQKRAKELGIRKVLGATQWNIFYLLSSSFVKQIILAFLIASPIAFVMMRNWLDQFQFRTNLGIGVFVISGLAAVLVALLTVSYRSLKAAHSNPVDSLRSE